MAAAAKPSEQLRTESWRPVTAIAKRRQGGRSRNEVNGNIAPKSIVIGVADPMRRRASGRSGAASSCAGRDWIRSVCSASGGPNEECETTTSSNYKPFTAYALVPYQLWHPSPEQVTVPALARVTRPDGLAIRLPDRVR